MACFIYLALGLIAGATFAFNAKGDPVLISSTYFGGSGDESGTRVAVDGAGNVYVAGTTTSPDLPTTAGSIRQIGGSQDAFVAKFSPSGALIYSTYIGGPCDDEGRDIAVDEAGDAYITGRIGICHFSNLLPGVLVAKLSPTGELVYQYVFSGGLGDYCAGQGIAVDADGNAYVTGVTQAAGLPTTPGAFRTNYCAGFLGDGFVAKVNAAGTGLVYCTYLCGSESESPNAIAVDAAGNAYVAGSTVSHDFPMVNAFQATNRVGPAMATGFVCKLDSSGSSLVYSTYLGGTTRDAALGIAVDGLGNAYVTGETLGGAFPTTAGVVQSIAPNPLCYYGGICSDAFVTKFSPAGTVIYSTLLAGETDDVGERIAVDAQGNACVAGSTASLMFPIRNASQITNHGVNDVFLTKLNPDATRILFSTYLGGGRTTNSTALTEGYDRGAGVAVDVFGNTCVTGYTVSSNFPVTPDAFQRNIAGGYCFLSSAPCGDSFLTKFRTDGAVTAPPIHVDVTPTEVQPGGMITAAWAGIPAPAPSDLLVLYRLGDGTGYLATVLASYPTTGAAADTLALQLPVTLGPGTYELRLMALNLAQYDVIARSDPLTILESVPEPITIVCTLEAGRRFHLRVTGLGPGTYNLEATETLTTPAWQAIATLQAGADHSAEFSETIDGTRQSGFYRVSR